MRSRSSLHRRRLSGPRTASRPPPLRRPLSLPQPATTSCCWTSREPPLPSVSHSHSTARTFDSATKRHLRALLATHASHRLRAVCCAAALPSHSLAALTHPIVIRPFASFRQGCAVPVRRLPLGGAPRQPLPGGADERGCESAHQTVAPGKQGRGRTQRHYSLCSERSCESTRCGFCALLTPTVVLCCALLCCVVSCCGAAGGGCDTGGARLPGCQP